MNSIVVICSSRHARFCNQFCDSIIKTNSKEGNWEFIFIINELNNEEDFLDKCKTYEDKEIEPASLAFLEKAKNIGRVYYNKDGGYELGALRCSISKINKESKNIILLQCTYEIKNKSFFEIFFNDKYNKQLLGFNPVFQNYFCKYPVFAIRRLLESGRWIEIKTKTDAVRNEALYIKLLKELNTDVEFIDRVLRIQYGEEERFGRINQIEDTKYTRKWKGVWHASMIPNAW
jgi:hypothetical protein